MPKILIGISILLMTLSLVFGFLNTNKLKTLRNEVTTTTSVRDVANQARSASDRNLKSKLKELSESKTRVADAEAKAQTAETELSKPVRLTNPRRRSRMRRSSWRQPSRKNPFSAKR